MEKVKLEHKTTLNIFYKGGTRVSIKSPLTEQEVIKIMGLNSSSDSKVKFEDIVEDETTASNTIFVYQQDILFYGIATVATRRAPSIITPGMQ